MLYAVYIRYVGGVPPPGFSDPYRRLLTLRLPPKGSNRLPTLQSPPWQAEAIASLGVPTSDGSARGGASG